MKRLPTGRDRLYFQNSSIYIRREQAADEERALSKVSSYERHLATLQISNRQCTGWTGGTFFESLAIQ